MQKKQLNGMYNILFSIAYKLISVFVSFIIPRLFIMNYGSEINGLQGSVAQIFTYIGLLEAGIGDASVQALYRPIKEKDYKKANGILSATSGYYNRISILYFFILVVACIIYSNTIEVAAVDSATVFLYIMFYGSVTGVNFLYWSKINVLMRASGELYVLSILNIISYLINNALKVIIIVKCWNIVWIQVGYFAVSIFCTLLCYFYVKRHYGWLNLSSQPDKAAIEKKNYALAHNVNYVIFSSIDITILTIFCDLKIVSVYTTYRMIVSALSGVTAPFIDGITFILGQNFKEEDKEKYCNLIDVVDVCYSAFAFALFTVMYIFMQSFMKLYTKDFSDTNYILEYIPILYVSIELLTVGREAMNRTVNVSGRFKETWRIAITETVINILVSLGAVFMGLFFFKKQEYALYGVLLGTIISMLYRTIAINVFANRKILNRSSKFSFKIILINLMIFLGIAYVAKKNMPMVTDYKSFFLMAAPFAVITEIVFFVIQLSLNRKQAKYIFRCLKGKAWKK